MLSVIICSISPERLQAIKQNINQTVGVEHEFVVIDNREKKWSIAKAYNFGARIAKYPYLFFVHEDVKFHSQNWGQFIEDKLQEPDCGVIGFCGSKAKLKCYSGWGQSSDWVCSFLYQCTDDLTVMNVQNVYLEHPFEEVVTLDGLGMFVSREVWEIYPFDEKILGFHCYDLDFSLQIAASNRYRNYVCCSINVLIEHFSLGSLDSKWFEETIRLHKLKWNKLLPIKVRGLELTKKREKKLEERFFNIFVRDILQSCSPEKKMILKEFLFCSYSLKHIGHCLSNLYKYFKSSFI